MFRRSLTGWIVCYGACISLLLSQCHCQFYKPYQNLRPTPFRSLNGTFNFPSGDTQIFDEGTDMAIRWTTDFVAVDLYVVYNASVDPPSVGEQTQLITGYAKMTFDWTMSCDPGCEAPFAIKAVDSFGDADALKLEGFWSRQFWIRPTSDTSSTQESSTSSLTSTTTSATSSTSSASTHTSLATNSTMAVESMSSASTMIPTSASTPTSTPEPMPATDSSSDESDSGSSSKTTIILASVGASFGAMSIVCGALYLWKRRGKSTSHEKGINTSSEELYSLRSQDAKVPFHGHHVVHEAPGWQAADPHELPGRPV